MPTLAGLRSLAFIAIEGERRYQSSKWPVGTGCQRSIGEEILCMEECLLEARKAWQAGDDANPNARIAILNHARKVAAVAVRCMENHGAPAREGW